MYTLLGYSYSLNLLAIDIEKSLLNGMFENEYKAEVVKELVEDLSHIISMGWAYWSCLEEKPEIIQEYRKQLTKLDLEIKSERFKNCLFYLQQLPESIFINSLINCLLSLAILRSSRCETGELLNQNILQ